MSTAESATIEVQKIQERYVRRQSSGVASRYSLADPYALLAEQEKDRAIVRSLQTAGILEHATDRTLLEIGCGNGSNLCRFLRLGFLPENITGNELLAERLSAARALVPPAVRLLAGDALRLNHRKESFDVVCLFTVLSSILDDDFQQQLASKAWELVKPGGVVLWYDFIYNNPNNPDVRGVPLRRVKQLFSEASIRTRRVTLAPPIGRRCTKIHPTLYPMLNTFSFLRSHVLGCFEKPTAASGYLKG